MKMATRHRGRRVDEDRHLRRRHDASPATTSCSRWARGRTSSARPAPRSTPFRCTRWPTRSGCARGSSPCSRTRIRNPRLIDEGALNFVVVGAGATGVETAGALADLINDVMPDSLSRPGAERGARLRDRSRHRSCSRRSPTTRTSTRPRCCAEEGRARARREGRRGQGRSGRALRRAGDHEPNRRVGRWDPGRRARGEHRHSAGRGGRIDVRADLTVDGLRRRVRARRRRQHARTRRQGVPAARIGRDAGRHSGPPTTSSPTSTGKPRTPFKYRDKGIMAMVGHNAADRGGGRTRREMHGPFAFLAWLGVHAVLLEGFRARSEALRSWTWDYFTKSRRRR